MRLQHRLILFGLTPSSLSPSLSLSLRGFHLCLQVSEGHGSPAQRRAPNPPPVPGTHSDGLHLNVSVMVFLWKWKQS